MGPDKVADLLKDEYVMLQNLYADMDTKGLTIKNWAITVTIAIIGASLVEGEKNLLWLAVGASVIFWYLEGYWRGLSHFFAVRIKEIETALNSGTWENEIPLQVYTSWEKEFSKKKDQTFKYMFKRAALLPHIFIPFFVVALYCLL